MIDLRMVGFPLPGRAMIPRISPGATCRLTSDSTSRFPNFRCRLRTSSRALATLEHREDKELAQEEIRHQDEDAGPDDDPGRRGADAAGTAPGVEPFPA